MRSALWFLAFLASCSRSSAKGLGLALGAEVVFTEACELVVAEHEFGAAVEVIGVAVEVVGAAVEVGVVGCGKETGAMEAVEVTAAGAAKLFEIRATVSLASRKLPVTLKSWLTSWSDFGVGFFRI